MLRFISRLFDYFEREETVPYHVFEDACQEYEVTIAQLRDQLTTAKEKVELQEKECYAMQKQRDAARQDSQRLAGKLDKIQNVLDFGCSCDDPTECERKGECKHG